MAIIHHSRYSSQPDIQIWCDDSWGIPKWGKNPGKGELIDVIPENVYVLDDDRLYTFDKEEVTCEKCLRKK